MERTKQVGVMEQHKENFRKVFDELWVFCHCIDPPADDSWGSQTIYKVADHLCHLCEKRVSVVNCISCPFPDDPNVYDREQCMCRSCQDRIYALSHETGTGKSCAITAIAETLRKEQNKVDLLNMPSSLLIISSSTKSANDE